LPCDRHANRPGVDDDACADRFADGHPYEHPNSKGEQDADSNTAGDADAHAGTAPSPYAQTSIRRSPSRMTTDGMHGEWQVDATDTIADLDVACINISHSWSGDLYVELVPDSTATSVVLIDRPGVPSTEFGCDSQTSRCISTTKPRTSSRMPVRSVGTAGQDPLAAFDGESIGVHGH
jgi:hypothetical protein